MLNLTKRSSQNLFEWQITASVVQFEPPRLVGVCRKDRKVANNHECFSGHTLELVDCGSKIEKDHNHKQLKEYGELDIIVE